MPEDARPDGAVELTDEDLQKVAGGYEQKTYTKDPYSKTEPTKTDSTDDSTLTDATRTKDPII